jgi:hypothetical protein
MTVSNNRWDLHVLSENPAWTWSVVPREQVEAKKPAIIRELLAKHPALNVEIAKALVMKA